MVKFEKIAERFFEVSEELTKACLDFLVEQLRENGGKISWDEDFVTVVYNGGDNDNEVTNAFSAVRSVYMENDKIYLETEDDAEYGIWNVDTNDVYTVCNFIRVYILEDKEEEEEDEEENEEVYFDINGNQLSEGDDVIWHDRAYKVMGFKGEIVYIADKFSTAEVFAYELEIVEL